MTKNKIKEIFLKVEGCRMKSINCNVYNNQLLMLVNSVKLENLKIVAKLLNFPSFCFKGGGIFVIVGK